MRRRIKVAQFRIDLVVFLLLLRDLCLLVIDLLLHALKLLLAGRDLTGFLIHLILLLLDLVLFLLELAFLFADLRLLFRGVCLVRLQLDRNIVFFGTECLDLLILCVVPFQNLPVDPLARFVDVLFVLCELCLQILDLRFDLLLFFSLFLESVFFVVDPAFGAGLAIFLLTRQLRRILFHGALSISGLKRIVYDLRICSAGLRNFIDIRDEPVVLFFCLAGQHVMVCVQCCKCRVRSRLIIAIRRLFF